MGYNTHARYGTLINVNFDNVRNMINIYTLYTFKQFLNEVFLRYVHFKLYKTPA